MFVITRALRTALATTTLLALAAFGQPDASLWAQGQQERSDVIITFRGPVGALDENLVRGLGGQVSHSYTIIPAMAASLPTPALQALGASPRVERIEPDGVFYADDFASELAWTWGVEHIGAGNLHPGEIGAGVRVAVIDSGIACNHPDLSGQCDLASGWDFVNNDNDPFDDDSHGTHVAGTIGGKRDGQGVVGVAPGVTLVPIKVLNANGSGSFSNVIAALDWAALHDIDVTNNSYGSSMNPGSAVENAFAATAAQGMLHIASAGNSGRCSAKGNTVGFPAQYTSVVAVGATTSSDGRPCFSSHGPAVEIAAPGVGIRSSVPGGGYADWNGTSMASPHVVGVAALVIGAGVADTDGNPGVDDEVRAILQETAIDLGSTGRDEQFGFGLVNAVAAVAAATGGGVAPAPRFNLTVWTNATSYAADETAQVSVMVVDEGNATVENLDGANFAATVDGTPVALALAHTTGGIYVGDLSLAGLSAGGHLLAVTATTADRTGAGNTSFSIDAAPPSGDITVSAIQYAGYGGKNSDKHFTVSINLEAGGSPVAGAIVEITLLRDGGAVATVAGTTDAAGQVAFSATNPSPGTYSVSIDNVTVGGVSYTVVTPSNSYSQS